MENLINFSSFKDIISLWGNTIQSENFDLKFHDITDDFRSNESACYLEISYFNEKFNFKYMIDLVWSVAFNVPTVYFSIFQGKQF